MNRALFDHGERYGELTVLKPVETERGIKWRVGCECGNSKDLVTANQLLKNRKTACSRCANAKGKAHGI